MTVYCENCQLSYNDKTSDTGKCPLCTKKANSFIKAKRYHKGKRASTLVQSYNLIKNQRDKLGGTQDYFGKFGAGKRKVGKQPL